MNILTTTILTNNFVPKSIELEDTDLVIRTLSLKVTHYPITEILSFIEINRLSFGPEVKFLTPKGKVVINNVANSILDELVKMINEVHGKYVSKKVQKTFDQISELVNNITNTYPNEDDHISIKKFINRYITPFQNQKHLFSQFFAIKTPIQIEFIAQIKSLEYLRSLHEQEILKKRKSFYDIVESNPLTHEQRLAVVRNAPYNMVLAAAGTGKSSVIVARTLDLISRKLAKPEEILVLAYNNSAAKELLTRLKDKGLKCGMDPTSLPVATSFHSLGRKILIEAGVTPNINPLCTDDKNFELWVTKWLDEYLSHSDKRLFEFIKLFPSPVNSFDFKSKAEYESYVRDNEFRTYKGHLVKSYQELLISNFLFENGIEYTYEPSYVTKQRIDIGFDYHPDFHITNTNIYIEHFGINRDGKTRSDIDYIEYNKQIASKRLLHQTYGTELIETFHYQWCENTLLSDLSNQLTQHNIQFTPLSAEEMLGWLRDQGAISKWGKLLKNALAAIRTENLDSTGIYNRLIKHHIYKPKRYQKVLDDLYKAYVTHLSENDSIDFDDMIIQSTRFIDEGVFSPSYRFILVDEFQDISNSRMNLIKSLIKHGPNPLLTVVGDDWQSIYRFSGGKLELTTKFESLVGSSTLTKLQKTFRYNNSIAHTAGEFVMVNPEQFKKQIQTHEHVDKPQIYLLDDKPNKTNGLNIRLIEVINKIRGNDKHGSIAVISRYNNVLHQANKAVSEAKIAANMYFWTYHKSKGLEADYCVLIGFSQGVQGFPSENKDNILIEALLPSVDDFKFSEERRLMYVGLTRARKKAYLIASPTSPSSFILELLKPMFNINIASPLFTTNHLKKYKCPYCESGYFKKVTGEFGDFYSCSSGVACDVGKAKICNKCNSPLIDTKNTRKCNNPECDNSVMLCQICGRPMIERYGKFGKFWGCSGYGVEGDHCKFTTVDKQLNKGRFVF